MIHSTHILEIKCVLQYMFAISTEKLYCITLLWHPRSCRAIVFSTGDVASESGVSLILSSLLVPVETRCLASPCGEPG